MAIPDGISFAKRFDGVTGSAIRDIFKVLGKPGMISFAGGNPAESALPDALCADIARDALLRDGKRILQYGATEGYPPLVESLREYARGVIGRDIPQGGLLPTTGSTQGMDLLCKALIDPGDAILVESPTFLGNMQCMRLYQANVVPVESDEFGLLPDAVEAAAKRVHPKLVYVIPTFQNPTGSTLAADRRAPLLALARKYGFLIAEDDPYRDLRYAGQPIPTIKSLDDTGHVVFLGSFSKIISPGIRVGYMVGNPDLIRKCTVGKQSADVHTASLTQAIVDQFLRRELLPDHIARLCADYGAKMRAMAALVADFPEGTRCAPPEGGLFLFAHLPEGMDALALFPKAVERGVAYVPGTHFYPQGGHLNTLRLNFSNGTPDQIAEGMKRLSALFAEAARPSTAQ